MRGEGISRRAVLGFLAGAAACAATPGFAAEARIQRLIREARALPHVSQRIDFISAALHGTRYRADTLVGGPRRPEQFMTRMDAFDCVTYCETVLAAALAADRAEFETRLQYLRYRNGIVNWFERNHYFFDWCQRNVDRKTCRWVALEGAIEIKKTVNTQKGLSERTFSMRVVPAPVVLTQKAALQTGDVVGFVSRRPNLDYFHSGLIAFGRKGALVLRHASESRGKVLDERMDRFVAANRVRFVTVIRPLDPPATVAGKPG